MLQRILHRAVTGFPKREEDNEQTFRRRIIIHKQETLPIVEMLAKNGSVINLDSEKQEDEIVTEFLQKLGGNASKTTSWVSRTQEWLGKRF